MPASAAPLRVLFIGNSYTYYHNLPEIMAGLAAGAVPPRQLHVAMEVEGGATLQRHWMRGTALRRIEEESWDFVVLQEQSMLGVTLVEGAPAINDPAFFQQYARLFDRAIRRRGARTVLYSTWSRRNAPASQQAALDAAYGALGREIGALVAPVGATWQRVRAERPTLELFDPDGSHPSPVGSLLAASVLWGVIGGEVPARLPRELRGHPVADLTTGAGLADTLAILVALPERDAALVRAQAAQVIREARAAGGLLPISTIPPLALALPPGTALSPGQLAGHWTGTMRLYGSPVEVSLHFTTTGGTLRGEWTEVYERGRLSLMVEGLRIEGTTLHFALSDPRFLMPTVYHRAVWRGGALEGVAEAGTAEQLPHLIGRWTMRAR